MARRVCWTVGFFGFLLGASTPVMARPSPDSDTEAAEIEGALLEESVQAHGALEAIVVPWGMSYTRCGAGLELRYTLPLVQRSGLLWNTTNLTFGVREFYGWVNNQLGAYVRVTPIAFFQLEVAAAWEYFSVHPFDGGIRVLTDQGHDLLAAGKIERGNSQAIDWVEGYNNREVFRAPVNGGGLRLKLIPVLQGRMGPVALQYRFMAEFNHYPVQGFSLRDVFSDTMTFTLRRLQDWGLYHELNVFYSIKIPRNGLMVGLTSNLNHPLSTALLAWAVYAAVLYTPQWRVLGDRWAPWFAARVGTYLIDPMEQYRLSWILAGGVSVKVF